MQNERMSRKRKPPQMRTKVGRHPQRDVIVGLMMIGHSPFYIEQYIKEKGWDPISDNAIRRYKEAYITPDMEIGPGVIRQRINEVAGIDVDEIAELIAMYQYECKVRDKCYDQEQSLDIFIKELDQHAIMKANLLEKIHKLKTERGLYQKEPEKFEGKVEHDVKGPTLRDLLEGKMKHDPGTVS